MTTPAPKRQPCRGSCHCGFTQYIVFLTLPHPFGSSHPPKPAGEQEIYRCNCTTCHKLGIFHVHPANQRDDFILLSPLDPDRELGNYQFRTRKHKWYFCPRCGVRCFTLTSSGEGERVEVELRELGVGDEKEGKREVWRAKWDGGEETRPYLSVNGTSINHKEEFDMRVLTEEKRVQYFDDLSEPEEKKMEPRWDRPHYGGCY